MNSPLLYFNVPVALCQYALTNGLVSPLQLYLVLKSHGHRLNLTKALRKVMCLQMGIKSEKTLKNNLKRLIELNWVGHNPKTANYFPRRFETVLALIKATKRIGAEFHESDFKNFRAYVVGVFIGYLSKIQYWKEIGQKKDPEARRNLRRKKAKESKKGGSSQLAPSSFFPVSNHSIAHFLNVSLSTAHEYKTQAKLHNYIEVKSNWELFDIPLSELNHYRKNHPESAWKLRVKNDKVYECKPDLVKTLLRFKRRKKTDIYKMGIIRGREKN